MKVLALAGYDSFLNTARLIAPYFERQGALVEFALVKARQSKQITPEQVSDLGISKPVRMVDLKQLCRSGEILNYDVVLSCLEGLSTRRLVHYLVEHGDQRPYVVCVYPGLILRYAYDGFSMRAAADQLWLNSKRDVKAYTAMGKSFGLEVSNARLFGNASLLETVVREENAEKSGPIVFFEQAVIPRFYEERKYLVSELCTLARRFPERQLLVKARAAGKKATLHRAWHAIEDLLQEHAEIGKQIPDNLHLTEEKAHVLLGKAAHCITVSSTVAVEALYANVPTTILSDFGAHDDYGLQYFYGSGLLRSFKEFDLVPSNNLSQQWLDENTNDPKAQIENLVCDVIEKSKAPRRPIEPFFNCQQASKLREQLIEIEEEYFLLQKYKQKLSTVLSLRSYLRSRKRQTYSALRKLF